MYYLIQSNINSDPEHYKVFDIMDELGLSYETIELNASVGNITIEADRKDVFVYGSVKLARMAKANTEWIPGSFYGGNHTYEVHSLHYKENMINYGASVFRFKEVIEWGADESKFIKPYRDAKVFTGGVFAQKEWSDFVYESLASPKTHMLNEETLVQASEPRKIIKEARIWVVGGKAICGTYYKYHGDVPFEQEVPGEAFEYVQSMVSIYNVADAFVMDVGLTTEGWKIVEINCINSAGFYNVNVKTLFRALEAYF